MKKQKTCKTCGFYENNCPFIRGTFKPYPNKVCGDYTYSVLKEQEQRENDGDDGKFVKILVRKEFAELFQKLGDEIQAGQSSFVGAMNQQEQPEVDLEVRKQIEELANDWHHKGFASDEDCPLCMQDLMDILWHFYELGKNSK